jgi:hypothetical protein
MKQKKFNFNDILDFIEKRFVLYAIPLVLVEFPLFFASVYISVFFTAIIHKLGLKYFDDFEPVRVESFMRLFFDAVPLFLIHALLYIIFRIVLKKKIHMPLFIALLIAFTVFSPSLGGPESTIILADFGFVLAMAFFFPCITFGAFSAVIELLDRSTALRGWLKIPIALLAAIPVGMLVSRILWIPIIALYLR